jgi:subtilisin family serine protease
MDPVSDVPGLFELQQSASAGDPSIRIAIIDGPADLTHPSLRNSRIASDVKTATSVRSEHGTHVASVISGAPGSAVAGIAPNCPAIVYPVYREDESGGLEPTSQAALALAINRALADGADIINISSGQQTETGRAQRILADAVRSCSRAGKLIVAAAGNDGCRCLHVPAALDSVLAVGACDLDGQPLPFSNFGDVYFENGILALGKDVKGASVQQSVVLRSGTSFATPIVTGVVALLLSLMRQRGQEADPHAVRAALLASALPCAPDARPGEDRCLAGRLNIPGAIKALLGDAAGTVMSLSQARAPPAMFDSRQGSYRAIGPRLFSTSRVTGEGIMADLSTRTASAPRVFGPDGNPVATATAVNPSEASSVQPQAAPPAGTASPAVAAPPMISAPPVSAVMPAGGGTIWVPMSMPAANAVMPSSLMPHMMVPQAAMPQVIAPASMMHPSALHADSPSIVRPGAADCGCNAIRPSQVPETDAIGEKVFAIGRLYYDFGTEARLDYFVYSIAAWRDSLGGRGTDDAFGPDRDKAGDIAAPYNPEIMVRFLLNLAPGEAISPAALDNMPNANALSWTLTVDSVPIYALDPHGVYGAPIFDTYVTALWYQEVAKDPPAAFNALVRGKDSVQQAAAPAAGGEFPPPGRVTRMSQAGHVTGTTHLMNGTTVPTLVPVWRGTYFWNLYDLLGPDSANWPAGAQGFLERIYNEFRNVGVSPQDRALNYSAMNALRTKMIFAEMAREKMRLDSVEVDASSICRPESHCLDITYRFFSPTEVLTRAREVFQYTIDVSDVVPVPVGKLRRWQVA